MAGAAVGGRRGVLDRVLAAVAGLAVEAGATVGSLWRDLAREHAELTQYERSISSAVNADYARMDRLLADGDEVAFLPPVSGG